eukprot:3184436-Rhodomonas_salina.1
MLRNQARELCPALGPGFAEASPCILARRLRNSRRGTWRTARISQVGRRDELPRRTGFEHEVGALELVVADAVDLGWENGGLDSAGDLQSLRGHCSFQGRSKICTLELGLEIGGRERGGDREELH